MEVRRLGRDDLLIEVEVIAVIPEYVARRPWGVTIVHPTAASEIGSIFKAGFGLNALLIDGGGVAEPQAIG